jgi:hypothetical protein
MEEKCVEFTVKIRIIWFFIFAALLIPYKGFAQVYNNDLPKTNLNLFQEITSNSLNELEDVVTIVGRDKIYKISIDDNTEKKEFFINELKQKFHNVKFVYEVTDSVDFIINVGSLMFKTAYTDLKSKNFLGDEYINRELSVMYNYSVPGKDISDRKVSKSYKDEIKVDRMEYVENGNYAFLKSVLPEKPFLKKILIPAVIVAVSAIATILFFTIRSK